MLPGAADVEAAAFSPDGVLEGVRPGALWLEMTSSNPDVTGHLAQLAGERRTTLLDCPVSGGVRGAREGRLTVIVAGPREALSRARPLLETLGERILRVGDRPGEGNLAKTINNMLSAINLAAAAEGLALAKAGGLAIGPLLEVLNGGTGASNTTQVKYSGLCPDGALRCRLHDCSVRQGSRRSRGLRTYPGGAGEAPVGSARHLEGRACRRSR
jgi:3-hydroxyisobutyrate dehydrogenase-like beta-hydroxyacid dehydrogenase